MTNQTSNTTGMIGENIFVELGLANASTETKMELLDKMVELVEKRVQNRVLETLTDEQRARVTEIYEGDAPLDDVAVALAEYIPNIQEIIQEETEKVKAEIRESVDTSAQA